MTGLDGSNNRLIELNGLIGLIGISRCKGVMLIRRIVVVESGPGGCEKRASKISVGLIWFNSL